MKKLLIVVVISIVIASLGLLTFNFLTAKESITVSKTEYYVNVNDTLDLESTIERTNAKKSTKVTISYDEEFKDNGESGSGIVYEDVVNGNYKFTRAGQAIFKVNATSKGFSPITITVNVGNGTENAPFYISKEEQLSKIGVTEEGNTFASNKYYMLVNDINLTNSNFTPLCAEGFSGVFNFTGHTIYALKINSSLDNAGLFAKVLKDGVIRDANIKDAVIYGSFKNVGVLAGVNEGTINRATITSSTVTNNTTEEGSNNGCLVGYNTGIVLRSEVLSSDSQVSSVTATATNSASGALIGKLESVRNTSIAYLQRSYASRVNVTGNIAGGVVGKVIGGYVKDVYSLNGSVSTNGKYAGGLIGEVTYCSNGVIGATILNGYNASKVSATSGTADALIGHNDEHPSTSGLIYLNIIGGLYYYEDQAEVNSSLVDSAKNYIVVKKFSSVNDAVVTDYTTIKNTNTVSSKTFETVNFDTERVWNIEDNQYPTLKMDEGNSESLIVRTDANAVTSGSAQDLIDNIKSNPAGRFILTSDIDGQNLSYETIFNFSGELNGDGHTIRNMKVSTGIFADVSALAKIYNVNFENIAPNDESAECVGVVCAVNEGTIENVKVLNCNFNVNNNNIYAGTIAGKNLGNINNVIVSKNTIKVLGSSNVSYIGGVIGRNDRQLTNALVDYKNKITINSNANVYVGGAVGGNYSADTNAIYAVEVGYGYDREAMMGSDADNQVMISSSAEMDKTIAGGAVGYNNGNMHGVKVSGKYKAYAFGGLAGYIQVLNKDQSIYECYVSNNTEVTGCALGGFAFKYGAGLMRDCSTEAILNCLDKNSTVSGISTTIYYNKSNNSSIKNCFISTAFSGEGKKYYETTTDTIRMDIIFGIDNIVSNLKHGDITNCPINADVTGQAISQNLGASQQGFMGKVTRTFSNTKRDDIRLTDDECKNPTNKYISQFDSSVWTHVNNAYPKITFFMATDGLTSIMTSLVNNLGL